MLAAAGPRAAVSGIGTVVGPEGPVDYEIGWSELKREEAWADRLLDAWGMGAGQRVLVIIANHEYAWAGPLLTAVRARRAVYTPAEPYGWDARRLTTFLRMEEVAAVIGLSGETVQAVAGSETIERLRAVPRLVVRPDARGPLRGEGIEASVIGPVGPALGLECPERAGLHVDPAEWGLDVIDGTVRLTSRADRAHAFSAFDTGVEGTLAEGPCGCGLPGPRVVLPRD